MNPSEPKPYAGTMTHDRGTVTWTRPASVAEELADEFDAAFSPNDLAHRDAAALRYHALLADPELTREAQP